MGEGYGLNKGFAGPSSVLPSVVETRDQNFWSSSPTLFDFFPHNHLFFSQGQISYTSTTFG